MSLILNEYEWAECMVRNHELGNKPIETLSRIARYYLANHYSKNEIRCLLDEFLIKCDPSTSLPKWSDTLDKIVKSCNKYPLVVLDGIYITNKELCKIEKLKGKQIRRLAFTLLCSAKYWDEVSDTNNHWANSPDKEIMQMANINTSIKRQSLMFSQLRACGLIRFSKKIDNLNVQVEFIEEGEPALCITDCRNLGYQYERYYGGPYFVCENCGMTVKMNSPHKGRRQKYCPGCAAEVRARQNINAAMRYRSATA